MTTTPEPVSPVPDTEALREGRLWSVLDWSLWGNGLGDVLRSAMADVMVAALTAEQREQAEACIKSWHERRSPSMAVGVGTQLQRERDEALAEVDRLKSCLLGRRNNLAQLLGQPASEEDTGWYGLCAQVQEREAGLRADLDHARRERDKLADLHCGEARTHDETIASLNAARAERDALAREVERLNDEVQSYQGDGAYERGHEHGMNAQAQADRAEIAGARTRIDALSNLLRGMARRVTHERRMKDEAFSLALEHGNALSALREQSTRVFGARTIPDDAAERQLNQAVPLVTDLVDGEDCSLDHHGYCQTHGWFGDSECPQARAKRWLKTLDDGATPTTGPAPDLAQLLWGLALTDERFVSEFGTGPSEARDALHEVMRQANALATTGPAPAAADGPDRHDADVTEDPEEPGWYIATCSACDWTTNGKESVVEDAADQHFSQAVLGVGRQASTTNPFWRLTVTELHTVLHANLLMASGCTGGSDCPAKLHAHGCALDPCTPATTSPVPAPADRPMPADEKPVLAHTSGWQGVVERAALRCCDVDGRNWNLVSETDRDRYRQYGMAMFRALPPHIAGQMHEPPPASVDRCCPACAADIEKVEAERGDGIQPDPWRCTLCGWTGQEWDLAAREDAAPPDDDCNDNLTAGFLRAPVGACSCRPTAAVIHVSGTYCGDAQYEQAVDAMRAAVGRSGDERDEEAVSAVLGYLANPTPEEKP